MNPYAVGKTIRRLRENSGMTQAELAAKLLVSDKTVSKWETSGGGPDVSLLEPIAGVFGITVGELLSGNIVKNANVSANMLRSKFYVCPLCGNIIHGMGEAVIQCHGIRLVPRQPKETDENHKIFIEKTEDEYYVRLEHEMEKEHYISFAAAASDNRIQMEKLYPEGRADVRFQMRGVRRILFYCNRDGLYSIDVRKGIHDRDASYDDTQERRELEAAAKVLFG